MTVETTKNQIMLNQLIGQKKEMRTVETDVIVNDVKPDVLNIISANGIVGIYKKDIMDQKIRIDGSINTYIIYLADDEEGRARSLNTSLDFTQIIDVENAKEGMEANVNIDVKSFDIKILNGRKLNIKANLETNVKVYTNEELEIVTGVENIDNIQVLSNTQNIISLIGMGTNRVSAKDTIAIDTSDDLAEIMKVDFRIVDEEIKLSYNKVLSKADAIVEIMYLTEDNRINTVTTKIPIMGFVDIQNVNENCICEVQNNLTNLIIKPNNTAEHSILVDAEIEVACSAYEMQEINLIEDLYSTDKEINYTKKQINAITERNKINDIYVLSENLRIPELTGKVLDVKVNPIISNSIIRNGKIMYEGTIELEMLFEHNNRIETRNIELPLNFDVFSDKIEENSKIETYLKINQDDFIIKDGTIAVTIGIDFNILEQKGKNLNIIQEVSQEELEQKEKYSMVIYFVKPDDTLWKIAKKFKSTVEDIARINEIENVDKLNIGQQLYIPKICSQLVN